MSKRSSKARRQRRVRQAACGSAFAAGLTLGTSLLQPSPAFANVTSYNRSAALNYANQWWNGRNGNYADLSNSGGDCTNYMSQILENGGTGQNGDWFMFYAWFHWQWNANWAAAQNWTTYQTQSHYENGGIYAVAWSASLANQPRTSGYAGDFFALHQSNEPPSTGYWNHLMANVGTEYRGAWYDVYSGATINYNQYVDVINQHTNDRYHDPWNGAWAAAAQQNRDDWKNWQANVIHINT